MILQFPLELIEAVIEHTDRQNDLLNLASTCHLLKSLIIPHHLEYREIRLDSYYYRPHVWKHLVRRKDLTKNIRVVDISSQHPVERYPLTLADAILDGTQEERGMGTMSGEELRALAHTMNEAFSLMENLTHFTFGFNYRDQMVLQNLEWIFLQTILLKPTIRELIYNGMYSCIHVPENTSWNLPNLRVFQAPEWSYDILKDLLQKGISQSQLLQRLIVPGEYIDPMLCIPSLEQLELVSINSDSELTFIPSVVKFLSLNPSIESLGWYTADESALIPQPFPLPFLPNLKKLNCRNNFFDALENSYQYSKGHAQQHARTLSKPWNIEQLEVSPFNYLTPDNLLTFECIDGESLREIALWANPDIEEAALGDWLAIPHRFPNIENLSFYANNFEKAWVLPFITLPILLNVIPTFLNLRTCHFTNQIVDHLCTRTIYDPTPRMRLDTSPYYSRKNDTSDSGLNRATSTLLQFHTFFLHIGQTTNVRSLYFPFGLKPQVEGDLSRRSFKNEVLACQSPIIDLIRQPVGLDEDPNLSPVGATGSIKGYATTLDRDSATHIHVWWQMRDEHTKRIVFSSLHDDLSSMGAHIESCKLLINFSHKYDHWD